MKTYLQIALTKENMIMFVKNFFLFFFGMAIIYGFYLNTRYKGLLKEQDVKTQTSLDS